VSIVRQHPWAAGMAGLFALFVMFSLATGFAPGQAMGHNFLYFLGQMLKVLPCVFVLIGLFDEWVKREKVEKHLGKDSGALSYLWAVLLAGTMFGGLHVALPVGDALRAKRAKLGVVLVFLSVSAACRIPMTLFEASFLGWQFTGVRFVVSLPLIVLSSAGLSSWCERSRYQLPMDTAVTGT
jgi:uncharacterized membrane protein YraQ (UPF0718 family)